MTTFSSELRDRYRAILRDFLLAQNQAQIEEVLLQGYDFGRDAVRGGLSVLEVTAIHQSAMLGFVLGSVLQHEAERLSVRSDEFLTQTLAPFEIATRGFQEANADLRQLNHDLDQRVRERTDALRAANERLAAELDERKRVAEAAEAERREKTALLDSTGEGIYGTDLNGRCTFINRSGALMLGYTSDEVIGTDMHWLIHSRHADGSPYAAEACPIVQSRQTGLGVRRDDEVFWRKDRSAFPAEYSSFPIINDGQITGFVVTFSDITTRKHAEDERERLLASEQAARAELLRAQSQIVQQERLRALGEMASGIAHDFNNALSPILGFSELLIDSPQVWEDRAVVEQYLQFIHLGAQDAASVVRRLREFYRDREPDQAFQPIQITDLVEQAIGLTQPKWKEQAQANGKQITVQTHLLTVPLVAGDAAELREALTNLIFNAVDALPDGGTITVSTGIDEGGVRLVVSDTGTGMSEEVRRRCLEPFFTTKGANGTGLGLAMVYGILQRHGSSLSIESEPGRGTSITAHLPIWSGPADDSPGQTFTASAHRRHHVLVVDDDPKTALVTVAYLTADGHTSAVATNGMEGLARFSAERFDLVITDQAMPGMTGDALARAIKKDAPSTPIIMLTGFGVLMQATGEIPQGVDRVVPKPATLSELRKAIGSVMLD